MEFGVTLPQTEIGPDPLVVGEFAAAAESAGFRYLLAYDHVLGADSGSRADWKGPYDHEDQFHEPFVLYGWLAARTKLELVTGVIVLPQRQTVLVAKQAAQIDILTGGKFRLGVGVGWNEVEYESLNENFRNRGRRYEEQVEVMRRLWTNDIVDFTGEFHRIDRAGILPRPIQRPIPIWMGSRTGEAVLRRIGRIADGWISNSRVGKGFEETLAIVRDEAARHDRTVGIQATVDITAGIDEMRRQFDALEALGVDYVTVNPLGAGLGPEAHVDNVRAVGGALELHARP
ncbi:MAG: LLM class F420-dependent oxidoreductase [Acidimicrobiia bacterium]